jgi:hypothetical protein
MFTLLALIVLAALTAVAYFSAGDKITYLRYYDPKAWEFFGARYDRWTVPHAYGGALFVGVGSFFFDLNDALIFSILFWTLWEVWDAYKTTHKQADTGILAKIYNFVGVSEGRFDVIDWSAAVVGALFFYKLNQILL